jgi:hypothetical protein
MKNPFRPNCICQSIFSLLLLLQTAVTFAQQQQLKVSDNQRYFVKQDGTPFFYLGDTAWELFHRLNREEADLYLQDRADKGFTVIQAVVLAELGGLRDPNPYGHLPLHDNDPAKPNEAYFQHVDYIVNKAEELGLTIGMLPTWGDKVLKGRPGGGPEIFTVENARAYGAFLGNRYKDKPIIWILGGDRNIEKDEHKQIWNAMAAGLESAHGGRQLMTYHPMGPGNSSKWFHNEEWLDFNMVQSGHSRVAYPNDSIVTVNYQLPPVKPTLDGEPRYEDHPINWKPERGWFGAFDVRQAAYSSLLAGAAGHTYGNHSVWQMWQPGRTAVSHARTHWQQALDQPGAEQMGYVRQLFESRPWQRLVPDQALIVGDNPKGVHHVRVARAVDGSFLFAYIPSGNTTTLKLDHLRGRRLQGWWYNPRTGEASSAGNIRNRGTASFNPPDEPGRGNDWVLVLDSKRFSAPGTGQGQRAGR